ncbi:type III-B CRISPR module RAMP protein Cmr4 [Sulfurisphaera javensis]|uniref:Type III-B CRISPR module RAMP protein Cmr4 n=1 Tax=Sulfurisphaera javensis TaxID=2049879 RepID=A0AAT9GV36_9CREN
MNKIYNRVYPFFIKAVTNLHVGSGGNIESEVDLPFQKDEIGFPTIYASSLKGAMKSYFLKEFEDDKLLIYKVFGDDESGDEASKISILDALLLGIPARGISLDSTPSPNIWYYVTSYSTMKKIKSYLDLIGSICSDVDLNFDVNENTCYGNNCPTHLLLNEIEVDNLRAEQPNSFFYQILSDNQITPLIVLDDLTAMNVISRSLLRVRRIKINRETKTVVTGGLWSEEYVPINTVLFSAILLKNDKVACDFSNKYLTKADYLIVGGKETIGKGVVKLIWLSTQIC